jgi:tripartite-type tricarboxylate transporter receptor subunit TctC
VPCAPHAIVDKLRSEVNAVLAHPDVAERLIASGSGEPSIIPFAEFTAMIRDDYDRYGKVIREIGLKVDD